MLPVAAQAADAVLTFDDIPAGTVLSTQQIDLPGQPAGSERGIEWGISPASPDGSFRYGPTVLVPTGIAPTSGANVLGTFATGGCPPRRPGRVVLPSTCTYHLTGRFPLAKQHVSVRIGMRPLDSATPSAAFVLRLLDVNGDLLDADVENVVRGAPMTTLEVTLAGRSAVYMTVESLQGNQGPAFVVDDVTFDAPDDPPPADFGMRVGTGGPTVPQLDLIPGQSATVPITLTRVNRSSGPDRADGRRAAGGRHRHVRAGGHAVRARRHREHPHGARGGEHRRPLAARLRRPGDAGRPCPLPGRRRGSATSASRWRR